MILNLLNNVINKTISNLLKGNMASQYTNGSKRRGDQSNTNNSNQQQMRGSTNMSGGLQQPGVIMPQKQLGSPMAGGPRPVNPGPNHLMINQYMQNSNVRNHQQPHISSSQIGSNMFLPQNGSNLSGQAVNTKVINQQQRMSTQAQHAQSSQNNTFSNTGQHSKNLSGQYPSNPTNKGQIMQGGGSFHLQTHYSDMKNKTSSKQSTKQGSIAQGMAAAMGGQAEGYASQNTQQIMNKGNGVNGLIKSMIVQGAQNNNTDQSQQMGMNNQFYSPTIGQMISSQTKKMHIQVNHVQSQKLKQSKTTSANSPVASGQTFKDANALNKNNPQQTNNNQGKMQLTNNYVGGGKIHPPQLITGTNQMMIQQQANQRINGGMQYTGKVQMKQNKISATGFSKTQTNSPTEQQAHLFRANNQQNEEQKYQNRTTKQKSNIINQLQQNQMSMLNRVSQNHQKNEQDSSSGKTLNEAEGDEKNNHQEELYVQKLQNHKKTGSIDSIKEQSYISIKQNIAQCHQKDKQARQSKLSQKSGSMGGQSSGTARASQKLEVSKHKKQASLNGPVQKYAQQRVQMTGTFQNQNQIQKTHQSSSSFLNNASVGEESIGVPQISQPANTRPIRTKNVWQNSDTNVLDKKGVPGQQVVGSKVNKMRQTNVGSFTMKAGAPTVVLASDSQSHLQGKGKNSKGAQLIQPPHFIKIKSKTNANPTRKSSPRFSGKFSTSLSGTNQIMQKQQSRDSNGQNSRIDDQEQYNRAPTAGTDENEGNVPDYNGEGEGLSHTAGDRKNMAIQSKRRQAPTTNSSGKGTNNYYVVSPGGASTAKGQLPSPELVQYNQAAGNQMLGVKGSMDPKLQNKHPPQMKPLIKGQSSETVNLDASATNQVQSPTYLNSQLQQNSQLKVFQNGSRRIQSPATTLKGKNKDGNMNQASAQQQYEMHQQAMLDHSIQQKIGGVASGKNRRENRNLLMKEHQNTAHDGSNSVVGSMGSIGSLGPLVGIQDGSMALGGIMMSNGEVPEASYNTMKYALQTDPNKAGDNKNQIQIQSMGHPGHQSSNYNAAIYSTGDGMKQQNQTHQLGSVGGYNFQNMTMSDLSNQMLRQGGNITNMGAQVEMQSSTHGNISNAQSKSSGPIQRQKKNLSQNQNQIQKQTQIVETNPTSNTYYDKTRTSQQQTKGSIQNAFPMKVNPISKTTTNASKNPSMERGMKVNNMATTPNNFVGGLAPISVSGGKSIQGSINQANYKKTTQYKTNTKPYAKSNKVSYANSPNNRSKGGSLGLAAASIVNGQGPHLGPSQQQAIGSFQSQSKQRQLQLRQQQQPIDQPMGDTAGLHKDLMNNDIGYSPNQHNESSMMGSQHHFNSPDIHQSYHTQQNHAYTQQFGASLQSATNCVSPVITSSKKDLNHIAASPNNSQQLFKVQGRVISHGNSPADKLIGGKISQRPSIGVNQMGKPSILHTGSTKPGRSGKGLVTTGPVPLSQKGKQVTSNDNANAGGQQYFNQYFKQNKKSNFIQGGKYPFGKYAQVDSPKDGSIERARQNDMMQQEQQVSQMNEQLQNVILIDGEDGEVDPSQHGRSSQARHTINELQNSIQVDKNKSINNDLKSNGQLRPAFAVNNSNQQCIINNIETMDVAKLSPRSKEVYLIRQLIVDCFQRYGKPPKTQLELYKIGKMLGKGAFGKVNLGLHRLTRKLVAIKSINMDFMKEESQKKKIMNEINILKSLRHPNNIKILETFQTDKHHMIVMELCPGGDLLNYVRKRRKLTEKYAKFVFKQIMEGIAYLHENKVSHRDIKLDNILLDGHGNVKIGDFGVSRKVEENELLFEQCGTPAYIAPEIVKDMGYKGYPVDIWSAGICLFAMLYGNVPFKANQLGDLNAVEQLNQEIEYKDTAPKGAIDLMKCMLQKAPKQRATAQDVLAHPWLEDEVDEHIDIFDEQELELIRKEFTYVLQKKKLKEFKEQRERLLDKNEEDGLSYHQASRRADDLNTEFTECSIQTHENSLLKNDSSRSVILCPFNTQTGDKTAEKIMAQAEGLMEDKDIMVRFHPRVRELDRNYEKLNNQDFDNGVYHKYAYKQKANLKKDGDKEDGLIEESIRQSDVQMNNLVSDGKAGENTNRKRRRENADINYQNYYIKQNEKTIQDTVRLGFPEQYIRKCLAENASSHCTSTYYLLCMDQNY